MYRQVLNGFAIKSLAKRPNIPDFHLMVGSAECLESLPVLVYNNASVPVEVVQNLQMANSMSNDEIAQAIADGNLEPDDLSWNKALLGSGLGV